MMNEQSEFHRPEGVYLLSHSVGLPPKNSVQSAEYFLDLWKTQGSNAWNSWLLMIDNFCTKLATLFNGEMEYFCPQTNITSALIKILYSLPARKNRTKILLSELDFPSTGFALQQAKKSGYHIEFVKPLPGEDLLESWERSMKDDVQLAFITHVYSENNQQNPVAELTQLCHERNIYSIVDIAQSAGIIPIDLKKWAADFIVGSCVKWLCGGTGAAFLWVNLNKIDEFTPVDIGWFSHEEPFEFDIYNFKYAQSARRFLGGTPSILPLYIANASIETMLHIGINRIYQHNQSCIDKLIKTSLEHGLVINSPIEAAKRGGTLVLQSNKNAVEYLLEQNIMVDERPRFGLRLSPHIYTTESDIQAVAQALGSVANREIGI